MKKPIVIDLLAKAAEAEPPVTSKSRSAWAYLFPVIDKLVDDREFTPWSATKWLVDNNAILEENRRICYHSYLGYAHRRTKRREKGRAEDKD